MKTQSEIVESAVDAGLRKGAMTSKRSQWGKVAILSMMAGAFIGLGGILSVISGCGFPEISAVNPAMQKLMSALVFPVGLFLVVTFGAELFTGNNAILMPALFRRQHSMKVVLQNWVMVWLGNFVGALIFTYFMVYLSGLISAPPFSDAVCRIAETKTQLSPGVIFCRGIGANWLVCMAVWLALGAKTLGGKALACWIPVAAFVALGYEHCIANMFFIPAGMMAGADVTFNDLWYNLFFSTTGNIVGGSLFVGCIWYWIHSKNAK